MADKSTVMEISQSREDLQKMSQQNQPFTEESKGPLDHKKFNIGNRVQEQIKVVKTIRPKDGTLINDIVISSCWQIENICALFKHKGFSHKLKVVYVAIFDGVDTLSKSGPAQTQSAILNLNKLCSQSKIELESYFMGIGLNKEASISLYNLFNSRTLNFKTVNGTSEAILQCLKYFEELIFRDDKRKLVCFNLDSSASMLGCRWHNMLLGVQKMCKLLTKKDLFRVVLKEDLSTYRRQAEPKVVPVALKAAPVAPKAASAANPVTYQSQQKEDTNLCFKKKKKKMTKKQKIFTTIMVLVLMAIVIISVSVTSSSSSSGSSSSGYTSQTSYFIYQTPSYDDDFGGGDFFFE